MKSTIIKIGNSKGIRIPKDALTLSGIVKDVEIRVKRGEIRIVPAAPSLTDNDMAAASNSAFAKDWLRPEEEAAWASYQSAK